MHPTARDNSVFHLEIVTGKPFKRIISGNIKSEVLTYFIHLYSGLYTHLHCRGLLWIHSMIRITPYARLQSPILHLKNSGQQLCKHRVERRKCHGRKRCSFRKHQKHMPSKYPFEVKSDPLSPFLAQHLIKMEFVTSTASWDYMQG